MRRLNSFLGVLLQTAKIAKSRTVFTWAQLLSNWVSKQSLSIKDFQKIVFFFFFCFNFLESADRKEKKSKYFPFTDTVWMHKPVWCINLFLVIEVVCSSSDGGSGVKVVKTLSRMNQRNTERMEEWCTIRKKIKHKTVLQPQLAQASFSSPLFMPGETCTLVQ